MNQETLGQQDLNSSLKDLVILELPGLASSFAGYILKQYGARVIRIESPDGEPERLRRPQIDLGDSRISASYAAYNAGKDIEYLELGSSAGQADFAALLGQADVLIHEVGPQRESYLDYSETRLINPRLIHATISPFGLHGPYQNYAGGDLVASAMSGFMHLTGEPDGKPLRMGGNQALKLGGSEAAAGIMVSLFRRDSTGMGQHVDLAVRDAMIRATVNAVPKFVYEETIQNRVGDHWGVRAKPLKALWRCADGWISFVRRGGVLGGRVNEQTVKWMGEAGMDVESLHGIEWDLMDIGNPAHRTKLDLLDDKFAQFLAGRSVEATFLEGLERGMTLAPVRQISEILRDQHLEDREFWDRLDVGTVSVRVPGRFVKTPTSKPEHGKLEIHPVPERTEA